MAVNGAARLGLEEFRIVVEEKVIRVEGGGPAGAYYGSLEVARRIREGRPPQAVSLPRSGPRFAWRVLHADVDIPGLSPRAAPADWPAFLDRVGSGRFNTLCVRCGDCFPSLVRLTRFPKAFEALDGEAAARRKAFGDFIALAEERNIRLLLIPTDLRVPEPFLRSYSSPGADAASRESLASSFFKECVSELLRTYPRLRGVGVGMESLAGRSPADAEGFTRDVFVEGIGAASRGVLFIALETGSLLENFHPSGIDVLREVDLAPAPGATALEAPPPGGRETLCGRIPLGLVMPGWPSREVCARSLEGARAATPGGFTVSLSGSLHRSPSGAPPGARSGAAGPARAPDREGFVAACIGLSAFEPSLEDASWEFLWSELFGGEAETLLRSASLLAGVWPELASFHGGPPWSPITSTEVPSGTAANALRDGEPFLSILELIFSPSGAPSFLSIPELAAREARGEAADPSRSEPPAAVERMLTLCAECIETLNARPAAKAAGEAGSRVAGPPDAAAAAAVEMEAFARLGEFHAHRIRAGVALLRHVAALAHGAREEAIAEMDRAALSWSLADAAFSRLRGWFPGAGRFPDLGPFRRGVEEDKRLVRSVKSDPSGFRASPLCAEAFPPSGELDFRTLRGFVDLGTAILDRPAVDLLPENQLFEAEEFSGTWPISSEVAGFSGHGYLSSGAAGRLAPAPVTLRLRVGEAATVHVWVRGLAGGGGEPRSVRVRAAGRRLEATHKGTEGPIRFVWERAGELVLEAGEVYLQIADDGAGVEGVDAVVLARESAWAPPAF